MTFMFAYRCFCCQRDDVHLESNQHHCNIKCHSFVVSGRSCLDD